MKDSRNFRFKFTPLIWILLSAVLAISLTGVGFNVYNLVALSKFNGNSSAITIVILIINVILSAFALSVMIFSKYVVSKKYVYCFLGFIPSRINVQEVTEITHFKKSDKLVAYFSKERYTVIIISPKKYDEFIKAVRSINAKIMVDTEYEEG